jgi:peptide/nickel transport system permease protein
MLGYLARRTAVAVLTVWAVSVITFVIIQLPPGDFATAYVAQLQSAGTYISPEQTENIRQQFGLNQPMYVQYYRWVSEFVEGDFGVSMLYNRPVRDVIGDRLALTIILTLASVLFTWVLALPIGILSAVKQYSLLDYSSTFVGFVGLAIPNFLLSLVVMYIGFAYFDTDVGGLFSAEYQNAPWSLEKAIDLLEHLWLPSIILGLAGTAQLIRIMRNNLLDELEKPYVVTARAKGLPEYRTILKYPVRVALNPFISTIGYTLPYVVSGTIIVSIVLGLPTVGPLLYQALLAQDMFLAGTIILLVGAMTVVGTLISDILLVWVDPRIRLGH